LNLRDQSAKKYFTLYLPAYIALLLLRAGLPLGNSGNSYIAESPMNITDKRQVGDYQTCSISELLVYQLSRKEVPATF
jgi:hypothetical protein